jgi:hypothetical protein
MDIEYRAKWQPVNREADEIVTSSSLMEDMTPQQRHKVRLDSRLGTNHDDYFKGYSSDMDKEFKRLCKLFKN